jgi:hypothetical protein
LTSKEYRWKHRITRDTQRAGSKAATEEEIKSLVAGTLLARAIKRHLAMNSAPNSNPSPSKQQRFESLITPGKLRDAVLHAIGANASHGLRRSNSEKRKAVHAMLNDEEWRRHGN